MKPHDMTDEQLRVRVAELLGWVLKPCTCGFSECPKNLRWHRGEEIVDDIHLPFWPADLNACHEMERAVPNNLRWAYLLRLKESFAWRFTPEMNWGLLHATARQRCEAFVEVMEK